MDALRGNAVIGQSGGPTAVINQSLVGVMEAFGSSGAAGKLLGSVHGTRGIVDEQFVDLATIDSGRLDNLAATPSAALGSSRDKPDAEYCQNILEVFKRNDVHTFFLIGGNDSADSARIVDEMAAASGYDLQTFHIPKTVDNDLRTTDHCPGYGSAARFVATAFMGDDRDNRSLPGVKIDIVMGRNAGWLTAASVLGRQAGFGPHLVYVPEIAFSVSQFLSDIEASFDEYGRCLIAVSEGIEDENGISIAQVLAEQLGKQVERDGHGNVQLSGSGMLGDFLADLVRKELPGGISSRVRSDTFGYLQRSFAGYISEVDATEARGAGRKAVALASSGAPSGSVAIRRLSNDPYASEFFRAELADVAKDTKELPRNYINAAGNDITHAFSDYALPLVGELPVIESII